MQSNRKYSVFISLMFLLTAYSLQAENLSLELGDDNFNIDYRQPAIYGKGIILDTRVLYTEQNHHQDLLGIAGLTTYTDSSLAVGIGFKIVAADPLEYYLTAMTLGIDLLYHIEQIRFETSYYYAGTSLTGSDGRNVTLFIVNLDYDINNQVYLRLGYRQIDMELINGIKTEFDDGAYLGAGWRF